MSNARALFRIRPRNMRLASHCSPGVIPCRYALQLIEFLLPSTAPCKSYRAPRDTLPIFAFDTRGLPTGFRWVQWAVTRAFFAIRSIGTVDGRLRLIRPHPTPQPHRDLRHLSRHQDCFLVGLSLGDPRVFDPSGRSAATVPVHIRHFALWPALRHSELPLAVSSHSPVHRDWHSRRLISHHTLRRPGQSRRPRGPPGAPGLNRPA
jgi:hypothetical protein